MPIQGASRLLLIVRICSAAALGLVAVPALTSAQETPCTRPAPGSVVTQPEEWRSHNGVLKLDLRTETSRPPMGRRVLLPIERRQPGSYCCVFGRATC